MSDEGMDKESIIQAMAESAHDAWMAAQRREGVSSRKAEWGEEFMVPFAVLSERGREFDRVIMRAILAAFDSLGLEVAAKTDKGEDAIGD